MRVIEIKLITETVAKLCIEANCYADEGIVAAFKKAHACEQLELPKSALETLIKNAEIATEHKLPICQDTGMVVVFVELGCDVFVKGDISSAINDGVRLGYREGYFRNSIVSDPLGERVNTHDNTPAVIYYDFNSELGEQIKITVAPKGFGSENMSGVEMLKPSDGVEGMENFVVDMVRKAGSNPCPPIIVGVGIGGTMDKAALLSKQALLREIGSPLTELESRLLERINALKIGVAGSGGKTTALAVHILEHPTHIAGLPVAVNIGCHVTRHKVAVL
ncbi:MAG: fumarate hydratase [Oscillospiraceae bacterium]|nr:fumarate hydratase [Oscillospiraceae bacterium]